MDRKIKKSKWTVKNISMIMGGVALLSFIVYQLAFSDRRSKLNVDPDKMTFATVSMGEFTEFIPQTGTVQPKNTRYLDAIEGGNIKRIVAESGAILKKGDIILELANLNRELSVMGQEASLNESINRVRQTRLQLSQNDLLQQQQLAQIDNQIVKLKPEFERQKYLFEKKLIAEKMYLDTKADYEYQLRRKEITYEAYRADSISRISQMKELNASEYRMMASLSGVGKILENLTLRSPIDGQLSTPQLEIGQGVSSGQRLGQVDVMGAYKVRCPIDELYLPRISTGLESTFKFAGKQYKLKIKYIYPTIANGRFEVDMDFDGEEPQGIRRGQSVRLRIALGNSSEQILLPKGGFYKDTGGNWVFVVLAEGNKAVKRPIKLGRQNTENFEVLSGLEPGDRVITSSYSHFGDNEVLVW
ncbi:MAG: efflux transporter periplasmic adaptor subunit [Bacteroidetes bacterium]|nr:MAG: efflux transporter periplasmic adaptor subunit [Bacteroidota bacterium]